MQETTLQNKMLYYSHSIITENQTILQDVSSGCLRLSALDRSGAPLLVSKLLAQL